MAGVGTTECPTENGNDDPVAAQPGDNVTVEVRGINDVRGDIIAVKNVEKEEYIFNYASKPQEKYEIHYRELKKALQCRYTTATTMVVGSSKHVCAPEFYVDLKLRKYNKTRLVFAGNSRADLREEFRMTPGKSILIRGSPGSGKTSFCNDLVFKWAEGNSGQSLLPVESTFLVYFSLSNLNEEDSIGEQLLAFLNAFVSNSDIEMTRKALKLSNERIIILLDGFDELTTDKQRKLLEFVEQKDGKDHLSTFENVILTCRGWHTFSSDVKNFSVLLHVDKLSKKRQSELIKKFFVGAEDEEEKLVNFELLWYNLRKKYGSVGCPLLLSLLCDFAFGKSVDEISLLQLKDLLPQITTEFITRCTARTNSLPEKDCKALASQFLNFVSNKHLAVYTDAILRNEFGQNTDIIINSGLFEIETVSEIITYKPVHMMFCFFKMNYQSPLQSIAQTIRERTYSSSSSDSENDCSHAQIKKFQIFKDMRGELSRLSKNVKILQFIQFGGLMVFAWSVVFSDTSTTTELRAIISHSFEFLCTFF